MTGIVRPTRIAVVGGTHGNEKSGYWTVRAMQAQPERFRRPGLEVTSLLANLEALRRNLRYIDRDLNRCFGPELENPSDLPHAVERRRAREIQIELDEPDLLIDVHNTTAAMGITWILTDRNPWVWWLAWQARRSDSQVRILFTPETPRTNVFLPSLGKGEVTIEIGPVPHGTHNQWSAGVAIAQVEAILDRLGALDDFFDPRTELADASFEYFLGLEPVRYPLDSEGEIAATIHTGLLGTDYQALADGASIFHDPIRDVSTAYRGETVHPVFIGEAAYVEKGIAFTPTLLRSWNGGREVLA